MFDEKAVIDDKLYLLVMTAEITKNNKSMENENKNNDRDSQFNFSFQRKNFDNFRNNGFLIFI